MRSNWVGGVGVGVGVDVGMGGTVGVAVGEGVWEGVGVGTVSTVLISRKPTQGNRDLLVALIVTWIYGLGV